MSPLMRLRFHPTASMRLVCLPHAGGSASFFRSWAQYVAPSVELLAVQYPGRENRSREPLVPSMDTLVAEVSEALLAEPARPTVLFGHSMGASVAYESLLRLEAAGARHFTRLCVSGSCVPGFSGTIPSTPRSDAELVDSTRALGGTRPEVLDDPDQRALLLPIIRNDYFLIDTYRPAPGRPRLRAELIALTGDADHRVTPARAREWATVTTGPATTHVFPGGHFYLTSFAESLTRLATTR